MVKFFIKLIVMRFDGIKMYVGGIGMMLTGLVMWLTGLIGMIGYYYPDANLPITDPEEAWKQMGEGAALITLGFSGIGLAHKLEKGNTNTKTIAQETVKE